MRQSKIDSETFIETILLEQTRDILIEDLEQEVDIVTFCEHPYYLDQPLHTVERFVLKVYYGLPLDGKTKDLLIRSYPFDEEGKLFTEVEYAEYLIKQKRTNLLKANDYEAALELILVCGRRSGKTFIASVVSSYEAYKLIVKGNPQKYYGLPQGEEIRITNIANAVDQALILAKATQNRILNSKWFIPYIDVDKTQNEIRLRTKKDLELLKEEIRIHGKQIDRHSSILISSLPCTARSARGGTVIVAILDEFAHFVDNNGNRSGSTIYEALTPSIANFGLDGKILCLSSPYTKSGIFFDIYLDSLGRLDDDEGDQNKRMFQLPTWEMNETITFGYLDSEKRRNAESFDRELGASFATVISGFFRYPERVDRCVISEHETKSPTGQFSYYIAVDPSANNHGYAMAMVHPEQRYKDVESKGRIIQKRETIVKLDRWMVWELTDPEFEGLEYIDENVVHEYIEKLIQKFKIVKIVYDQFDSTAAVLKWRKMGINSMKTPFSRGYNMKIYNTLKTLVYESRLELFNNERGIKEVKSLQEKKVGKRQFVIQAPKMGEVVTDDMADVLANAAYIALTDGSRGSGSSITGTDGINKYNSSGNTIKSFHAYKRRKKQHKHISNLDKAHSLRLTR